MTTTEKFLTWIQDNGLVSYNSSPVFLSDIESFESAQGIRLPEALRELYLSIGGQESEILNVIPYRLIPFSDILKIQEYLLSQVVSAVGHNWKEYKIDSFEDANAVRNVLFESKRFPVFQDNNDNYYCLDYVPAIDGKEGQVIAVHCNFSEDVENILLMFDSFDECLEDILADLSEDSIQDMDSFFQDAELVLENMGERLEMSSADIDVIDKYDEEIATHIERTLGTISGVLHEMLSAVIRIHIYHVAPTENYPFHILITSGMSCLPMQIPISEDEVLTEDFRRAELLILLPSDWDIHSQDVVKTWPIEWLKILARLPHERDTWIAAGHTIALDADVEKTLPGTPFNSFLFMPPILSLPEDFISMQNTDGERIHFYTLIPLYQEELSLKETAGLNTLLEHLDKANIKECVDVNRVNSALLEH